VTRWGLSSYPMTLNLEGSMAKIREDLIGVIHLGKGVTLSKGDDVPAGVEVHESLLQAAATSKPESAPEPEASKPKRGRPKKVEAEDAEAVD